MALPRPTDGAAEAPGDPTGGPAPAGYRPGVGIVLVDGRGLVLAGERLDAPGAWQMPQGGIDPGETAAEAARRELREETGVASAALLAVSRRWRTYDLPGEVAGRLWGGRYRGQAQVWTLFAFSGSEAEIDLAAGEPEFSRWKWSPPDRLIREVAEFKREVYAGVLEEFAALIRGRAAE